MTATTEHENRRELVDGRWVATHIPPEHHGKTHTYSRHKCRCAPCVDAKALHRRDPVEYSKRLSAASQSAAQAEVDYIAGEYKFARNILGYDHGRAAGFLETDPEALRRRLQRNGYGHLI